MRRRRIVLLLVFGMALVIVGGAMAWNRDVAGVAATGGAKLVQKADTASLSGAGGSDASDESATSAPADSADAQERVPAVAWPDWKPTPQAQKAIDTAMANGRPPQFLVASFDGAADIRMYRRWLALAEETGARFTFFVTGIYMLLPEFKDAYQPPRMSRGFSNLGGYAELAGNRSARQNLRDNWRAFDRARMMGNEIGSHYVSHICEQSDAWSEADWVSEQSQWERLMLDVNAVNRLNPPISSIITKADFHGGRTPCLNGNKDLLFPAMKSMGFEYDSSETGILGQWPVRKHGLWSFPLPTIPRVGSKYDTLAMDYNFYVNHGKTSSPAQAAKYADLTYRSYIGALRGLYRGTRAPLVIGSHFSSWNLDAYNTALDKTLREACAMPEVACVTSITLARWLDQQSPAKIAKWQAGSFKAG